MQGSRRDRRAAEKIQPDLTVSVRIASGERLTDASPAELAVVGPSQQAAQWKAARFSLRSFWQRTASHRKDVRALILRKQPTSAETP